MSAYSSQQDIPAQIFHVDGTPFKFFIQKDIHPDLRRSLQEAIVAEGGSCELKVPIKGYIVIQPGTPEAERLRESWQKADRPDRNFVPVGWIEASRRKRRPLPQIFVDKQKAPITIHIHNTIANVNTREEVVETIMNHGGDPFASREEAMIILASAETESFREMRKALQGVDSKHVEDLKWLETCVEQGFYYNSPNPVKNPGGRRPGDERTAFTEEDESNLCGWIASVIPFKESGGRTGNKIYQELVSRANNPGYEWVARHTWQSWRERYKKNAARLDLHIAAIVNLSHAGSQKEAQFGYFRLTEGKPAPLRRRRRKVDEEQTEQQIAVNSQIGVFPSQASQESEWSIREGQDPTPDWAKRSAPSDLEMERGDQKRLKTGSATFRTFVLTSAPNYNALSSASQSYNDVGSAYATATEFVADFGVQGAMHHIDQAILDIAREYQFLQTEVRAFYDKTGDMDATRERFKKMRLLVNTIG